MIISKDVALLLRIISTAPAMATKLFSKRHRFLQGGVRSVQGGGRRVGVGPVVNAEGDNSANA